MNDDLDHSSGEVTHHAVRQSVVREWGWLEDRTAAVPRPSDQRWCTDSVFAVVTGGSNLVTFEARAADGGVDRDESVCRRDS